MFNKVIIGNGGILRFNFECYKDHKMCDKAVDNYSHALRLLPIASRLKLSVLILLQYNLFLRR